MKFSPGKSEKIVINLRLEVDLLEKIDREASKRDLSRNEFICQAIAYAMDNMDSSRGRITPAPRIERRKYLLDKTKGEKQDRFAHNLKVANRSIFVAQTLSRG